MSTLERKPGDAQARAQPQADYRITLDGRDLSRLIAPNLISLSLSESRADEADMLDLAARRRARHVRDSEARREHQAGDRLGRRAARRQGRVHGRRGRARRRTGRHHDPRALGIDDEGHARAPREKLAPADDRRDRAHHRDPPRATAAVDATLAATRIDHVDQTQESDMSFLTRLARRYDAVMTVKDKRLLFMPIGSGKPSAASRSTCWPSPARAATSIATTSRSATITRRCARTITRTVGAAAVGGRRRRKRQERQGAAEDYATEAEARAAAQADYARTQRGQSTLSTLALGRPELFPEMPVTQGSAGNRRDAVAREEGHAYDRRRRVHDRARAEVRDAPKQSGRTGKR